MWLTLQYHSFLSVQKTGITFKRTAHTICLCTPLMQCFNIYAVQSKNIYIYLKVPFLITVLYQIINISKGLFS